MTQLESEPTELAVVGRVTALTSTDDMRSKMAASSERRQIVVDYIRENFKPGVDFGVADDRSPKNTLLKPGAEKICRLFNTRPVFTRDDETWEMLGRPAGTVCYHCQIIDNATGEVVGEGRGAETLGNKKRDANKTIKLAQVCALKDAALYTFCLSEFFTQDDASSAPERVTPEVSLTQAKQMLLADIGQARRGCASTLTDQQFIIAVIGSELHKKKMDTVGEVEHIRRVVLDEQRYDYETAQRMPEGI